MVPHPTMLISAIPSEAARPQLLEAAGPGRERSQLARGAAAVLATALTLGLIAAVLVTVHPLEERVALKSESASALFENALKSQQLDRAKHTAAEQKLKAQVESSIAHEDGSKFLSGVFMYSVLLPGTPGVRVRWRDTQPKTAAQASWCRREPLEPLAVCPRCRAHAQFDPARRPVVLRPRIGDSQTAGTGGLAWMRRAGARTTQRPRRTPLLPRICSGCGSVPRPAAAAARLDCTQNAGAHMRPRTPRCRCSRTITASQSKTASRCRTPPSSRWRTRANRKI